MTCRRQAQENMNKYIRRLKEARLELEDEDEQMVVSNKMFAWMLLRRSGLTSEEKSRVRGAIHCSEDPCDIAYALKRCSPHTSMGFSW